MGLALGASIKQAEKAECNLPAALLAEIRSYQDVVNQIANAAINGSFTGNTWRGYVVLYQYLFRLFYSKLIISAWPNLPTLLDLE